MEPYYSDDHVVLYHGDCRVVLAELPDASVHAVVTDPPYELGFMGKGWDASGIAYDVDLWRECLRILKPGGHLLAFGGSRTWHRLAAAIEDAGFELRDSIAWMYGSGFPKSLDVSKALDKAAGAEREVAGTIRRSQNRSDGWDRPWMREQMGALGGNGMAEAQITAPATDAAKQWAGWGTALKPSHEPVVCARKPLAGTVAANVLEYGTGGLNVDACRVGMSDSDREFILKTARPNSAGQPHIGDVMNRPSAPTVNVHSAGRWPTNVVLTHSPDCGEECVDGCPVAELDRQSGVLASGSRRAGEFELMGYMGAGPASMPAIQGDSGGASRFFPVFRYEAKADAGERPKVGGVAHPTVKPVALMRWLVRLVTPPGGLVLEPFAGSGTTLQAARAEGFDVIGVEREADYLPLIRERLERVGSPVNAEAGGWPGPKPSDGQGSIFDLEAS